MTRKSQSILADNHRLHLADVAAVMALTDGEHLRRLMDEWKAEVPELRTKDPDPMTNIAFREWVWEKAKDV